MVRLTYAQVLLKLFALRMFIELLEARRVLGPQYNARLRNARPALTGSSAVSPVAQPPSDAAPSMWTSATSFLAREANRVAWRRRNAHLL
jgi:hypothetical protein